MKGRMCFPEFYEVEEDAPNEIPRPDSRLESDDDEDRDQLVVDAVRNDPLFALVQQNSNHRSSLPWFIYLQLRFWWFVNRGLVRNGGTMLDYFESLGRDGALRYFRLHGAPRSVARAWRRVYYGPEPLETMADVELEDMPSTHESSDDEPGIPFDDADTGDYYLVPLFRIKSEEEDENEIIDVEHVDYQNDIDFMHLFEDAEEERHNDQYYADDEDDIEDDNDIDEEDDIDSDDDDDDVDDEDDVDGHDEDEDADDEHDERDEHDDN